MKVAAIVFLAAYTMTVAYKIGKNEKRKMTGFEWTFGLIELAAMMYLAIGALTNA